MSSWWMSWVAGVGGVAILAGLRWALADFSFRKDSGLVDAPGRRVVGAQGENRHCPPYPPVAARMGLGAGVCAP